MKTNNEQVISQVIEVNKATIDYKTSKANKQTEEHQNPNIIMESIFGQKSGPSGATTTTTTGSSTTSPASSYIPGQYSMPQGVQSQVEKARNWIQNVLKNSTDTIRQYINQYPPLAAFLFTLLLLSAIPVSAFVVFGVSTTVFFLSIALIGFSVVEGTILITSGGILLAVLSGIALFTTCTFGFLALCYMGYRGSCAACCQLWQGASYISSKVQEQSQSMMPQSSSGTTFQSSRQ